MTSVESIGFADCNPQNLSEYVERNPQNPAEYAERNQQNPELPAYHASFALLQQDSARTVAFGKKQVPGLSRGT
jgi:hypothetical protein